MAAKTITGTWDEICQHQSELQGHQLSVTVLIEPEKEDRTMKYVARMKNRTPEEIEDVRARSESPTQRSIIVPPGKTGLDLYLEIRQKYPIEPETEEETRRLDEAVRELS